MLAVEDEPDLLGSLTKALRKDGYEYDAIVLDIMLTRLDGWELLRRLRKTRKAPS